MKSNYSVKVLTLALLLPMAFLATGCGEEEKCIRAEAAQKLAQELVFKMSEAQGASSRSKSLESWRDLCTSDDIASFGKFVPILREGKEETCSDEDEKQACEVLTNAERDTSALLRMKRKTCRDVQSDLAIALESTRRYLGDATNLLDSSVQYAEHFCAKVDKGSKKYQKKLRELHMEEPDLFAALFSDRNGSLAIPSDALAELNAADGARAPREEKSYDKGSNGIDPSLPGPEVVGAEASAARI